MPRDGNNYTNLGLLPPGGNVARELADIASALTYALQNAGGGGTDVVANPGGAPISQLNTITIGDTDYTVAGMGGGGVAVTQRVEALSFTATGDVTTGTPQQSLSATPVSVVYGPGAAEILSGTGGETTFTIATAGAYLLEWVGTITSGANRAQPTIEVQDDATSAVYGTSETYYIRDSGETLELRLRGYVIVPTDNAVCKAIVRNRVDGNRFSVADGHQLRFYRIQSVGGGGGWRRRNR